MAIRSLSFSKILNRYDPEGRLEGGAPDDEYEPEADDIAGRLRDGKPVTSEVLAEIWQRWFGPNGYAVTKTPQDLVVMAIGLDALRRGTAFRDWAVTPPIP
ncbi:MAG: hypothetical protein M0T80_09610 [Actinomycetota bacterium]|nr:hypothetical protein [Actinomycetota bacterium]